MKGKVRIENKTPGTKIEQPNKENDQLMIDSCGSVFFLLLISLFV